MNKELRIKQSIIRIIYSDISHISSISHPYGISLIFDPLSRIEGKDYFKKYIKDNFVDYESSYRTDGGSFHIAFKTPSNLSIFLLKWGGYCKIEKYESIK